MFTSAPVRPAVDDDAAEGGTSDVKHARPDEDESAGQDGPAAKKPKLSGAEKRRLAKEEKKKQRGSNKGRRWAKTKDELDLCWRFAGDGQCEFGEKCVDFNVNLWTSLTVQ